MSENDGQWYSNKEIFENLNGISKDLIKLRGEMKETRILIKQYNGLREKIEGVEDEVRVLVNEGKGRRDGVEGLRAWGGWLFGAITLIILLYNQVT